MKKDHSSKVKVPKFLLIAVILVAPLILLSVVMYPMIVANNVKKYSDHFGLPKGFTRADINDVVTKMHQDSEYQFYFKVLGPDSINRSVDSIYAKLDQSRDSKKHLDQITQSQDRIESIAVLLNSVHYPENFSGDPLAHPDLVKKIWDFVREEFELTTLGLCYKSTYDLNFKFEWSATTQETAQKLTSLLFSLSKEHREQIDRNLNN